MDKFLKVNDVVYVHELYEVGDNLELRIYTAKINKLVKHYDVAKPVADTEPLNINYLITFDSVNHDLFGNEVKNKHAYNVMRNSNHFKYYTSIKDAIDYDEITGNLRMRIDQKVTELGYEMVTHYIVKGAFISEYIEYLILYINKLDNILRIYENTFWTKSTKYVTNG